MSKVGDSLLEIATVELGERRLRIWELEEALENLLKSLGRHSGACCVCDTKEPGKIVINELTCVCGPEIKAAYRVLGKWKV